MEMIPEEKTFEIQGKPFLLRQIEQGDAEALHVLDTLCFPPERAFTKGYFHLLFTYMNAFGWCLNNGSGITGFILLTPKRNSVNIATIDVHPDYRRQGLGRSLMTIAEDYAVQNSFRKITLQVEIDNLPAHQLYRKLGYRSEKILKNYYQNADAVLMLKMLT